MRTRIRRALNRAVVLPLIVALPAWGSAIRDPFAGLAAVEDGYLDRLRGGFENTQGFQFSFAIERAVVINGELLSSTRLVLSDLSQLLSGGVTNVQFINSARSIVQNGLGNTVSPAPAASAPPSTTTAASNPAAAPVAAVAPTGPTPAVQAAPSPTTASVATPSAAAPTAVLAAPVAAPAPAPVSTTQAATAAPAPVQAAPAAPLAGPLLVQMNAGGQTIVVPNASAIVTAVQNTVNEQIIQTRTTIDAALSSISALRTNTLTQSIRQQALDGMRRP